ASGIATVLDLQASTAVLNHALHSPKAMPVWAAKASGKPATVVGRLQGDDSDVPVCERELLLRSPSVGGVVEHNRGGVQGCLLVVCLNAPSSTRDIPGQ